MTRRAILLHALLAVTVALGAGCERGAGGRDSSPAGRPAGEAAARATVGRPIRVGPSPVAVAVGEGSVWVANNADGTVTRVDARERKPVGRPVRVGSGPLAIAVGESSVWVATGEGRLARIEPGTGRVAGTPAEVPGAGGVAVGAGAVWVTRRDSASVVRVDPASGQVEGAPIQVGRQPTDVAVAAGAVWVANSGDGTVTRIDPAAARPEGAPIRIGRAQVLALAASDDGIWAAGTDSPLAERIAVARIDPRTGEVASRGGPVPGGIPMRLAVGLGSVWVTDAGGSPATAEKPAAPGVRRLDPGSARLVGSRLGVGAGPSGIAVGAGAVWVTSSGEGTVTPIEP